MQRRTREQWRELCAASYASGLTIREYAALAGVNPRTLAWWRTRLRAQRLDASEGTFVEVVECEPTAEAPAAPVVVVRLGGLVVELDALPPVPWLAELASRC